MAKKEAAPLPRTEPRLSGRPASGVVTVYRRHNLTHSSDSSTVIYGALLLRLDVKMCQEIRPVSYLSTEASTLVLLNSNAFSRIPVFGNVSISGVEP